MHCILTRVSYQGIREDKIDYNRNCWNQKEAEEAGKEVNQCQKKSRSLSSARSAGRGIAFRPARQVKAGALSAGIAEIRRNFYNPKSSLAPPFTIGGGTLFLRLDKESDKKSSGQQVEHKFYLPP